MGELVTDRQLPEPRWKQVERERRKAERADQRDRRTGQRELERLRGQRHDLLAARLQARERKAMVAWREQRESDAQERER
ncbi:MAG: hypothetical protein ACR2IP_02845 [Solirubrobacteraceae bacterium]